MVRNIFTEMGVTYTDVYPYPTDDAPLWLTVFEKAHEVDREFFAALLFLRGIGCSIVKTGNPDMPYKLVPIISETNFTDMDNWNDKKRHLVPWTKDLIRIFKEL